MQSRDWVGQRRTIYWFWLSSDDVSPASENARLLFFAVSTRPAFDQSCVCVRVFFFVLLACDVTNALYTPPTPTLHISALCVSPRAMLLEASYHVVVN